VSCDTPGRTAGAAANRAWAIADHRYVGMFDEREDQTHGARFSEGDKSGGVSCNGGCMLRLTKRPWISCSTQRRKLLLCDGRTSKITQHAVQGH
jgi:hypothetical protein